MLVATVACGRLHRLCGRACGRRWRRFLSVPFIAVVAEMECLCWPSMDGVG